MPQLTWMSVALWNGMRDAEDGTVQFQAQAQAQGQNMDDILAGFTVQGAPILTFLENDAVGERVIDRCK